jgi:hypothetical protein
VAGSCEHINQELLASSATLCSIDLAKLLIHSAILSKTIMYELHINGPKQNILKIINLQNKYLLKSNHLYHTIKARDFYHNVQRYCD